MAIMVRRNPNTVESSRLPVSLGAVFWYRSYQGVIGSPVTQWTDLSGNGYHLTDPPAPSAATTPTVVANVLHGKPAVRFDGAANRLESPALSWSVSKRFTLVVLSCQSGLPAENRRIWGHNTDLTGFFQSDSDYRFDDTFLVRLLETYTESTPQLKVVRRTADTTLTMRRARAAAGSVNCTDWAETVDTPHSLGGLANDSFFWSGDVFEVQGYSSSLSDANVIAIENDIYARWGL